MMGKYSFFQRKDDGKYLRKVNCNSSFDRNRTLLKFKKVCYLFCLIILFATSSVDSQVSYTPDQKWQWLHPKPQGNILRWCKMWDNNNWYMAGNYATFLKTSDAGNTWSLNYEFGYRGSTGVKSDIRDAHFFNESTGILVGSISSVFKTIDGGNTFDSIPGLYYLANTWNSIFFVNENTGYITGDGRLVKTTDGGNTWFQVSSISSNEYHNDLYTFNDTLIFVCSSAGRIQRSNDGGVSWENMNVINQVTLYKLCFVNMNTGFACGQGAAVLRTTNSGINWISVSNGLPFNTYNDIDHRYINNIDEIFLTGNAQYIYKSTNLGNSWDTIGIWGINQTNMGVYQGYLSTEVGSNDTLLTVGTYSLVNKRNSPTDRILYSSYVKFGAAIVYDMWVNENNIWAVGSPTIAGTTFDQIIFSSDKGETWQVQESGNSQSFYYSISMCNQNTGFVSGTGGSILKTSNGGQNWAIVNNPSSVSLNKIDFVNENVGWVFGDNGFIFKTTNSGFNWNLQNSNDTVSFLSAHMLNENTGWAVGEEGRIIKTVDGGANWFSQNLVGVTGDVLDIEMLNESSGFACGYSYLIKTTNGGENWNYITCPVSGSYPQSLDFINMNTGIINFGNNTIKTTDGGNTWSIDYLCTPAFRSGNGTCK
jgi:photosystem II stability/assembly factor-like uncharacterized protein